MRATVIYCDVCRGVIVERSWEDEAHPLVVKTTCSYQNPLGEITGDAQACEIDYREVCQRCQRSVSEAITEAILRLREPKPATAP